MATLTLANYGYTNYSYTNYGYTNYGYTNYGYTMALLAMALLTLRWLYLPRRRCSASPTAPRGRRRPPPSATLARARWC